MKKIFILLAMLVTLIGCQKEITTFDEIIENGKVEIDGIKYYIQLVSETSYEYDSNNNLITTIMNKNDSNMERYTEFKYNGDLLIEEIEEYKYKSNLYVTVFYHYSDEGRRIKAEEVLENGNTSTREYQYNSKARKIIFKDEEGNISYYIEEILDNKDNVLTYTMYDVDDKIYSYTIQHGDESLMTVNFFEYEYNKDYLPVSMKLHQVKALMTQDKIRDYWD